MTSKSVLKRHAVQNEQPVLTADKMREDFEAWYASSFLTHIPNNQKLAYFNTIDGDYVSLHCQGAWAGYQAATEQSTAKIAQMQARIDELVEALKRIHTHTGCSSAEQLEAMRNIYSISKNALAKVKDEK